MNMQLDRLRFENNKLSFRAERKENSRIYGKLSIHGKLSSFIVLKNFIPIKIQHQNIETNLKSLLDSNLDYLKFDFPDLSKEHHQNPQYYPYFIVFFSGVLVFCGKVFCGNFSNLTFENLNENFFIGEMKNGVKSGFGELRTRRFFYIGNFSENHFSGQGKLFKEGCHYKGNFVLSQLHGEVTVKKRNQKLKEFYNNGVLHSNHPSSATPNLQNARTDLGLFRNIKKLQEHSIDYLKTQTGQKIPMLAPKVWIDYEITLSSTNPSQSVPGHSSAKKEIELPNGEIYHGHLNEHKRLQGFGKYFYLNGMVYIGEFNNGQKHGVGTLFQYKNILVKGHWEQDALHGKARVYEQGHIINCFFTHGKISHVASVSEYSEN